MLPVKMEPWNSGIAVLRWSVPAQRSAALVPASGNSPDLITHESLAYAAEDSSGGYCSFLCQVGNAWRQSNDPATTN